MKPPFFINPQLGYCADIEPELAYQWMSAGEALLVDVRSEAEFSWVGVVPGSVLIPWKTWPSMQKNVNFQSTLEAKVSGDKKIIFLCRSGARSAEAARLASSLGLVAFNVDHGFEGDHDELGQRGKVNGWKAANLPWQQG